MELQHQIYLLVAIFGGVCTLLLVLIIILGIFVRNVRKSIKDEDEQPPRSINYGFEHDTTSRNNITNDDLRSMKSEAIRRPPHKSNLTKPRNDESSRHQSNVRPITKDTKRSQKGNEGRDQPRKQRQYSESGDTSGRYSDSAFDNEINNMFDIDGYDDDDDDRDSVVSADRNYNNRGHRNHSQGRSVPPPPPSNNNNNRNRNNNNPPPGMNRGGPPGGGGGGGPRSMYPAGNPHEAKTYFNERGMNY